MKLKLELIRKMRGLSTINLILGNLNLIQSCRILLKMMSMILQVFRLFKMLLMDIMAPYFAMDRLEPEKHFLCLVSLIILNKEELSQEPLVKFFI